MSFLKTFDTGMKRAIEQENRSLSFSLSKQQHSKAKHQRCCLFAILLTPLLGILLLLYVLSMYNTLLHYESQHAVQGDHVVQPLSNSGESSLLRKPLVDNIAVEQSHHSQAQEDTPKLKPPQENSETKSETLVLSTKHGKIRIAMRPDLSEGSVAYIHRLVGSSICKRCNLYRAEKPGILQGIMANSDVGFNELRGDCPKGAEKIKNDCPKWDNNCGCHGPLMTKGSVAWAAGQAGGPDFFIDNYKRPAQWWGTQHTNFGRIEDEESFRVVDYIFDLPVMKRGGMTYLNETIHFDLALE